MDIFFRARYVRILNSFLGLARCYIANIKVCFFVAFTRVLCEYWEGDREGGALLCCSHMLVPNN